MLILERGDQESIVIGDDIIIQVVRIEDYKVRIGVEAPKDIEIDRVEIRRRKDRERGR